ncbi:MAG: ASCH domain-containing protein [Phycisphaerae bacterium]|nr:ASCH domain-containing protein [Phycisphaerae bacterium]
MKALSFHQPWATLIAIGAKRIETRSWRTNYRGLLAIHAGRRWTRQQQALAYHQEPFRTVLAEAGKIPTQADGMVVEDLPRGCIIAVCKLVDCVRIHRTFEFPPEAALYERAFGDYRTRRFAWLLEPLELLVHPVPLKGHLGLFEIDDALLEG